MAALARVLTVTAECATCCLYRNGRSCIRLPRKLIMNNRANCLRGASYWTSCRVNIMRCILTNARRCVDLVLVKCIRHAAEFKDRQLCPRTTFVLRLYTDLAGLQVYHFNGNLITVERCNASKSFRAAC